MREQIETNFVLERPSGRLKLLLSTMNFFLNAVREQRKQVGGVVFMLDLLACDQGLNLPGEILNEPISDKQ